MMRAPLIKTLMVLFAMLFLSAQTASAVHATECLGEADHHQDCITCVLSVTKSDAAHLTPAPEIELPVIKPIAATIFKTVTASAPRSFDGRAPPPRGPPVST